MSKEESSQFRINIAFTPSPDVVNRIIRISQSASKLCESYFVIDGKKVFPHLTIYAPVVTSKQIPEIYTEVNKIVKKEKPYELSFRKILAGRGYIGAEFALTEKIKLLHTQIVEAIHPLREIHPDEKFADMNDYKMTFSKETMRKIRTYGFSSVFDRYHPHITIVRFTDEKKAEAIAKHIIWKDYKITLRAITIYQMGSHGTCIKPLRRFNLQ